MPIPFSIEATVDRFEGDYVALRTADGQEILWPADRVPDDLEEGSPVHLTIAPEEVAIDDRGVVARDILNEIFASEGDEV